MTSILFSEYYARVKANFKMVEGHCKCKHYRDISAAILLLQHRRAGVHRYARLQHLARSLLKRTAHW